ncbi:thyroglobulin-like [Ostrea edulis]|uniref:thyroglobulin-like n=1 Tax=Ostrea edulis TaxID=37623 RepID=UPI0024AF238F|nr:thyroglobulin-like [Ostrea edulis]
MQETYLESLKSSSYYYFCTKFDEMCRKENLAVSEKVDVENIAKTQKKNDAFTKYVLGVSELEFSVQQLNSPGDILNLNVNGTIFISTGQITEAVIHCPSGEGRVLFYCAKCPSGTHSSSGKCILCSIGTYQDEAGQTGCKRCPLGMTTKYVGSQDQVDCFVEAADSVDRNSSQGNAAESKTLIITTIVVCLLLFLGVVTGVTIFRYKRLMCTHAPLTRESLTLLSMPSPDNTPLGSKPQSSM